MTVMTLTIEPDELLGLTALAELDMADGGKADPDVATTARALMRTALAGQLTQAGLPWAPPGGAVNERAAEAAQRPGAMRTLTGNKKLRRGAVYVLAVAGLVVLWGGYVRRWAWTGLEGNGQLWDWLHLLLLPVILGTIPLWIQDREYIGRTRSAAYASAIVAWIGFVIAGYLVPLNWTGFRGQTLWNWFELLLLPAALVSLRALTGKGGRAGSFLRSLRPYQKGLIAALAAGWVVTVIGGYALRWEWTGYTGNTVWDWVQLLLVPLVFPTIVYPALLKWVTGNAAGRASEAAAARTTAAGRATPNDTLARV